jgi:hypothetical protein
MFESSWASQGRTTDGAGAKRPKARAYLAKKGHPAEVVNRTYDAWWKSMIPQLTLWSQPYIREGDF